MFLKYFTKLVEPDYILNNVEIMKLYRGKKYFR